MIKITLANVKVGMLLARDVKTHDGNILVITGSRLETDHIQLLNEHGIQDVHVDTEKRIDIVIEPSSDMRQEITLDQRSQLKVLFKHTNTEHEMVAELLRLCTLKIEQGAEIKVQDDA